MYVSHSLKLCDRPAQLRQKWWWGHSAGSRAEPLGQVLVSEWLSAIIPWWGILLCRVLPDISQPASAPCILHAEGADEDAEDEEDAKDADAAEDEEDVEDEKDAEDVDDAED